MKKTILQWFTLTRILVIVIVMSFLISVGYSFYFRIYPLVDAQAYDQIAVNIVDGYGFREDRSKSFEFDTAIIRAGPGYQYFLAGVYKIFGHHYEVVWVVQALFHALSALLLYGISKLLFVEKGRKVGVIAAALFGLSPDLIEIGAMLMTETLYLFFIILTIYAFLVSFRKPEKIGIAALLGFITGLGILTRPTVLLFIPVFLFLHAQKRMWKNIIIFIVCLGLTLSPWVIRNYSIYHQFILTTMIGEYNIWIGNTLNADGGQISGGFNPLTTYTEKYGFFGLKEKASSEFFGFISAHPFTFLKLTTIRFVRYFSLIRPMGFWFYQTGVGQALFVAASALWIAFLFLTGYSGLALIGKERKTEYLYFITLALTSPLLLFVTVVQSRYRFPIYPFLALSGAYAIEWVIQTKGWWKNKIFLYSAIFLFTISALDILSNIGKVIERIKSLLL